MIRTLLLRRTARAALSRYLSAPSQTPAAAQAPTAATALTSAQAVVAAEKCADHIATEKSAIAREPDPEALSFLQQRASALGLKLSLEERKLIVADADTNGDGRLSAEEWRLLVDRHAMTANERLTLGQYILKTIDQYQGQHYLRATARVGQYFFALCGANVAAEAGMHVVGATMVGVVTAVTGGTFNAVLLQQPVAWVRDPALLVGMILVGMAGFYVWPLADRHVRARRERERGELEGGELEGGEGSVGGMGVVGGADVLSLLAPPAGQESALRYGLESVALGSAAVVAAQTGAAAPASEVVASSPSPAHRRAMERARLRSHTRPRARLAPCDDGAPFPAAE